VRQVNGEVRCPCVPFGVLPESGVQVPFRTRADGLPIPAESAMPIRPGCGDSPQGRARRPSRPPARCLRLSSRSRPPKPEHPTPASAPGSPPGPVPRRARRRAEPEWPAKPQQNYDVHHIGNGQPIGRPPSTSRPVCPERVPVMKTIRYPVSPWQSGPNCSATGPDGCSWPNCGRRTAGPDRPDRPPDRPQPLNHSAIGRAIRLFRAPAARTECSIWMLDSQRIPAFRSA
jgi:hypothetical protein